MVRTHEFERAAAKLGFRIGMVAENRTGRPERPIELAALSRQMAGQFMGFLRMAAKTVSSSRRNGEVLLVDALERGADGGGPRRHRAWGTIVVYDMMCRISMPWIPCVEGVDVASHEPDLWVGPDRHGAAGTRQRAPTLPSRNQRESEGARQAL